MYGFTLVLALIVTGGLIAYVGDRIGRKVGRRRLTIFGLRPRYTSIIITIITGIMVSTTTLVVLSFVSNDVRTALFHMHEIQATLATTQQDLKNAEVKLQKQEKELKIREARAQELSSKVDSLTEKIGVLSQAMDAKAKEYATLVARNDQLSKELQKAAEQRQQATKQLGEITSQLETLKTQYAEAKMRYEIAQKDYAQAKQSLARAKGDIAKLEKRAGDLEKEIKSLEADRKSLQEEKMGLSTQIKDLTNAVNVLYSHLQGMSQYVQGMSLRDLTYRRDEIILATTMEGGGAMDQIKKSLEGFLVEANQAALKRGARIEGRDKDAIVWLADNLDEAYRRIHDAKGSVVVRMVSAINAMQGQPVYAYIEVFERKMIYKAGDMIASRTVDGSKGPDYVQDQLMALLIDVNSAAIKKGMISDAEGTVGRLLGYSELRDAKTAILQEKKPVEVLARAVKDTWNTEGPLEVTLEVKKKTNKE
ncbi:MAG TPA: DUF3084 domain-containing protein [Firmicutes bacterium]|nr:DUF3084 domain-containing protein [Bacillota bacterium]